MTTKADYREQRLCRALMTVTPIAPRRAASAADFPAAEPRLALLLSLGLLALLAAAKPLAGSSPVGPWLLSFVTITTLCLPLWRADHCGLPYACLGLHLRGLRQDLWALMWLSLLLFPVAALLLHLALNHGASGLRAMGWESLAALVPQGGLALPDWPQGPAAWSALLPGLSQIATILLVVALPEELFFRGYLQGQLQRCLPARTRLFGVLLGRAACLAALLFALGHFVGEWNPLRLATFFPALLFAWLYQRSGSIIAPLLLHTLCNLFAGLLPVFT